ncbi:MAG: type II toxin-antitoxin system HigB family toxin [Pseudohongiellaceae bacterium]
MRIIAKKKLRDFWVVHPDSEQALKSWYAIAVGAEWDSPQDIKNHFSKVSILSDNRAVFDIVGGSYRLIVKFNYAYRIGYVRFIGTHNDYDSTDAETI